MYAANDTLLQRPVVLKMLHTGLLTAEADALRRCCARHAWRLPLSIPTFAQQYRYLAVLRCTTVLLRDAAVILEIADALSGVVDAVGRCPQLRGVHAVALKNE